MSSYLEPCCIDRQLPILLKESKSGFAFFSNIQKANSFLHTNNAWSIYALNQTTPSEHCLQQEIKVNPNETFCFSSYIQAENSKDFALAITISSETDTYTYASFFDASLGEIIKTSVFDSSFNLVLDPSLILNIIPRIEPIDNSYYRVSISGKINQNIHNPTLLCKLSIPSEDGNLYYSSSTQKSILVNCAQFCVKSHNIRPYKYIRSDLQPSKGEIRTGLFYKTPESKFIEYSFEHDLYLNNKLAKPHH